MNQGDNNHHSSLQATPASLLLYSFLQSSPNCSFTPQLCALKHQLLASATLHDDFDDGQLQTDGNRFGSLQREAVSETEEDRFHVIGTQLAEIGDSVVAGMEPSVFQNVAQIFTSGNISNEEKTRCISLAVQTLVRKMPPEMEQEKAMLIVALLLAKKVAERVPSLLQQVFSSTVNYINRNLLDCVNNLTPEPPQEKNDQPVL